MLNGIGTQAGLKQLIDERRQADQGTGNMGRLTVSSPPLTTTVTSIAEDGFAVRLQARRGHLVADRRDRDAAGRLAAGGDDRPRRRQSERRRQGHIQFQSARRHDRDDHADCDHDNAAAGRLVRDRRRHRGDDGEPAGRADLVDPETRRHLAGRGLGDGGVGQFLQFVGNDRREASVNNQAAVPAPITGNTLLSGAAGTDSLATNFAAGDTITVNGTPITFVASGATGNQLNVTDNVQTLLAKIDSITGTTNPSTVSGGAITLHGG